MSEQRPDPIDVHVGQAIRARRKFAGLSQELLAEKSGVTFQQIQKYERAANRVSASRLARIADALGAPIAIFFPAVDDAGRVTGFGPAEQLATLNGGQDLARAFLVMDEGRRRALLNVANVLCDSQPAEEPGPAYVTGGDEGRPRHVA